MTNLSVAPIVEGHGEVKAVPVLIRRIAAEVVSVPVAVSQPWRMPKGRMVKASEMQRVVAASKMRVDDISSVIALVDADDDEPEELRSRVLEASGQAISCAVAVREYEAWILAGWKSDSWDPALCETVRDAKGRLGQILGRRYSEVRDQAGVTARFDLHAAQTNSPSFRGFVDVLRGLLR